MSPIGPTLIFGTTSLLAGLLIPLLPETKNKTSPDTIQVRARLEKCNPFYNDKLITGGRGILQDAQQALQSVLNIKFDPETVVLRVVYSINH